MASACSVGQRFGFMPFACFVVPPSFLRNGESREDRNRTAEIWKSGTQGCGRTRGWGLDTEVTEPRRRKCCSVASARSVGQSVWIRGFLVFRGSTLCAGRSAPRGFAPATERGAGERSLALLGAHPGSGIDQFPAVLSATRAEVDEPVRDRKSTRLNSSHLTQSRMPSSA